MQRKAAVKPADEQQKEEEATTTQSQHEHTAASEIHTSNSTAESQEDRQAKKDLEDKITKEAVEGGKSHNEETLGTKDVEKSDNLPGSDQEIAKKDYEAAEESSEMAETANSHNERKPDGVHSKSMLDSIEVNDK